MIIKSDQLRPEQIAALKKKEKAYKKRLVSSAKKSGKMQSVPVSVSTPSRKGTFYLDLSALKDV